MAGTKIECLITVSPTFPKARWVCEIEVYTRGELDWEENLNGESGGGDSRASLVALKAALDWIEKTFPFEGRIQDGRHVFIQSKNNYLLNGATSWVHRWAKNRWKKADGLEIKNRDLWEPLYQTYLGVAAFSNFTQFQDASVMPARPYLWKPEGQR